VSTLHQTTYFEDLNQQAKKILDRQHSILNGYQVDAFDASAYDACNDELKSLFSGLSLESQVVFAWHLDAMKNGRIELFALLPYLLPQVQEFLDMSLDAVLQ